MDDGGKRTAMRVRDVAPKTVLQKPQSFSNIQDSLDSEIWAYFKKGKGGISLYKNDNELLLLSFTGNKMTVEIKMNKKLVYKFEGGKFSCCDKKRRFYLEVFSEESNDLAKVNVTCCSHVDYQKTRALLKSLDIQYVFSKNENELMKRDAKLALGGNIGCSAIGNQKREEFSQVKLWDVEDVLSWANDQVIGKDLSGTFDTVCSKLILCEKITGPVILGWTQFDVSQFLRNFDSEALGLSDSRKLRNKLVDLIKMRAYDCRKNRTRKKIIRMLKGKAMNFTKLFVERLVTMFSSAEVLENSLLEILYSDGSKIQEKSFSVKVNIVENLREQKLKNFRKAIGPLLSLRDKSMKFFNKSSKSATEFGAFHCSFSIGNLQLEWVDSELVIVRPVSSENAIISIDIGNYHVSNPKEFVTMLSREIMEWNGKFTYSTMKCSGTSGNCQTFVLRMITDFLKMDWQVPEGIKNFLEEMKFYGRCEMKIRFTNKFAELFLNSFFLDLSVKKNAPNYSVSNRVFRPKTHKELDLFVQHLFKVCPTFYRDYRDYYDLLKGFDRAFWLRYSSASTSKEKSEEVDLKREFSEPARRRFDEQNWRISGCPFTPPDGVVKLFGRKCCSKRSFRNSSSFIALKPKDLKRFNFKRRASFKAEKTKRLKDLRKRNSFDDKKPKDLKKNDMKPKDLKKLKFKRRASFKAEKPKDLKKFRFRRGASFIETKKEVKKKN